MCDLIPKSLAEGKGGSEGEVRRGWPHRALCDGWRGSETKL